MSRVDKIRKIDEYITWVLVLNDNNQISLSSYDELSRFLRKEVLYWKKYESEFKTDYSFYSDWYNRCSTALNNVINNFSEEYTGSSLSTVIIEQFNNKDVTGVTSPHSYSNNITIQIKNPEIASLNNSDPDATAFAYSNYYNLDNQLYYAFLDLVEKRYGISDFFNMRNIEEYQQKAAIAYIGFQLKANKYPSRNILNKEKIDSLGSEVDVIKNELSEKRNDINTFLDDCREQYDVQYADRNKEIDDLRTDIDAWYAESDAKVKSLEKTYHDKLQLSAPVEHWKTEADRKNCSFKLWLTATVIMSIILLAVATVLVYVFISQSEIFLKSVEDSLLSYVPQYFVFVVIITFLVYVLRVFIKIAMSEKHMQTEYAQKAALTYFYLSLLQDSDSEISATERPIILAALFSKADTGLIKSDGKSDPVSSIIATLKK